MFTKPWALQRAENSCNDGSRKTCSILPGKGQNVLKALSLKSIQF